MVAKGPIPTLHDVAEAAGVSTATVSRCLNFPDRLAKQTREKVMNAVETLGYSPNFGARAMAARRTNTIGAIIPTMENAIFARGLQGFQDELRMHGFTMLVASTSYRPEIEEEQIRSLVARGADALLLIGHERDPNIYRFLDKQGIPALATWVYDETSKRPSIGFDNRVAMMEMATKVIEFGHKTLAVITAESARNDRASARLKGIEDAMTAAGLDKSKLRRLETPYGIDEGAEAFEQLMQLRPRPSAVFCGNDVLAVGAIRRARDLGLALPDDVSIVGFDDIELAQVVYPALTTVHVPHLEMGRLAARALVDHVKFGTPLSSVKLATRLVLRDTLGPAK